MKRTLAVNILENYELETIEIRWVDVIHYQYTLYDNKTKTDYILTFKIDDAICRAMLLTKVRVREVEVISVKII